MQNQFLMKKRKVEQCPPEVVVLSEYPDSAAEFGNVCSSTMASRRTCLKSIHTTQNSRGKLGERFLSSKTSLHTVINVEFALLHTCDSRGKWYQIYAHLI
ncbi:hypothetical protein CEXT_727331 [Caerostris extrusa]|uniref:Uncharacterized protein n=1 Tax=Caerostris extrusa TaxID=172846 RepID=A0AAV4Y3N3_CAEEX|nr:hypothetical protein CEXT_727331 [Caerostris extrusa]